jgi:hypothetical protein
LGKSLAKLPVNPPDGVVKLVTFPLKATADMNVALTQGWQNLPRLYGDTNIRKAGKVTGIGTGLVEAAKGFTLGLADAATGIFEQPYLGAQKEVPLLPMRWTDDRVQRAFLRGLQKGLLGCMLRVVGVSCTFDWADGSLLRCSGEDHTGGLDGVSEKIVFR